MELLGFFLVAVALFAGLGWIGKRLEEARERREAAIQARWRTFGRELGMAGKGSGAERRYRATVQGFDVLVLPPERQASGAIGLDRPQTTVRLDSQGAWPDAFRHGAPLELDAWTAAAVGAAPRATDAWIASNDGPADEAATLGVLDAPTRAAWSEWERAESAEPQPGRVGARDGGLLLVVPGDLPEPLDLRRRIDRMARIAAVLDRRGRSLARCLADGLDQADEQERAERLRILATRFAADELVAAACARWLDVGPAGSRLRAAQGAGAKGAQALARLAGDTSLPEPLRLEALESWMKHAPVTTATASAVEALLEDPSPAIRAAALEAARAIAGKPPAELLLRLAESAGPAEGVALARLVGGSRRTDCEPALLRLLASRDRGVQDEALRALQDAGSVACVQAVLPLTRGALVAPETKLLARSALQAVRARLGDVDAGRLDLAGDPGLSGTLGLADTPDGGALSPEPGCAGRLSAPDVEHNS